MSLAGISGDASGLPVPVVSHATSTFKQNAAFSAVDAFRLLVLPESQSLTDTTDIPQAFANADWVFPD